MKAKLLLCCVIAALYLWIGYERRQRHVAGQDRRTLLEQMAVYRTRDSLNAASVGRLTMSVAELRKFKEQDVRTIRDLSIKLRRVESLSVQHTESVYRITDTVRLRDTVQVVEYADPYVRFDGQIDPRTGRFRAQIITYDTLVQVVHRVPRRFLFFRFGTKAIRQEIVSRNPHTRIVYAEYIELQ